MSAPRRRIVRPAEVTTVERDPVPAAEDGSLAWDDDELARDIAYEEAALDETDLVDGDLDDQPPDGGYEPRERSLLRASAMPAVGTTLSRASGLIRVGALTYALGLTTIADVYNLANTTPNILYELVLGGVLSSTLVPLFVRTLDDPDDETASVVTTVSFAAIVALTLVGVLVSPFVNRLFALPLSGAAKQQQLELGDDFLALLVPQILFYGVTTLVTALLHARRRFAPPAFTPILTNLVTAAAAIAAAKWATSSGRSMSQVYLLGLGTTAGVAAMAIALVPYLRRSGINLRWRFKPRHPAVRSVLRLSGWTIGFAAANQIALMIILTLARGQEAGTVSAYQYAFIFFQLPHGLIAVSLMTAVLPELAEAAVDRDERAYIARFREGLSLLMTFLVPAAVGLLFIAGPLIAMFLQRGSFDAADTDRTAAMLRGFAFGLPAFSIYLYCVRAFFARRDTRTPFFLNVVQNALNVAIILPFTNWLGPEGLSLAYTASYWFIAVAALVMLNRRVPHLLTTRAMFPLVRSLGVGAAVTVALVLTSFLTGSGTRRPIVELAAMVVVAVFVFVPTTVLLKPRGFEPAVARLRQGLRSRGRTMAG